MTKLYNKRENDQKARSWLIPVGRERHAGLQVQTMFYLLTWRSEGVFAAQMICSALQIFYTLFSVYKTFQNKNITNFKTGKNVLGVRSLGNRGRAHGRGIPGQIHAEMTEVVDHMCPGSPWNLHSRKGNGRNQTNTAVASIADHSGALRAKSCLTPCMWEKPSGLFRNGGWEGAAEDVKSPKREEAWLTPFSIPNC
jgi:hypothetical protein